MHVIILQIQKTLSKLYDDIMMSIHQTSTPQYTLPEVHTVKSCLKAAAYVHFLDVSGRLLYETGLCAAVVQLLAAGTVQSMHAGIQHPCVPYMTSHTTHTMKSRIYKPRLLFESGFHVGMQLQKCGFCSRAASIPGAAFIQDSTVSTEQSIHAQYLWRMAATVAHTSI